MSASGERSEHFAGWRRAVLRRMPARFTRADVRPFVLALIFPLAAALAGAGFQAWFDDWDPRLGRTLPWLALVVLVGVLFVQLRKQRAGTLYAIEALDQNMLSWHRTAEEESRRKQLDYRPIYRPLTFQRGDGTVDLTAELEELRRSFEFARQTDDESTGMTVAPNMLWPAALYLGFMTPFPPDTHLIEFGDGPKLHDFELGSVVEEPIAFREKADCGCDVEVFADAVDPTTGVRQQSPSSAGCVEAGVKVLSIEVTRLLDWPGPSLLGMTPCCATRLVTRITAPCGAHAGRSLCSILFASSGATRIGEKQNVNAKDTPVEVPSDQAMPISAWLSKQLLDACHDTSHTVLVRATLPKVMGLSLGAHLRGHAALAQAKAKAQAQAHPQDPVRSHHGTEDVWGNLLLVDHPYPDPPRLVRVHPCQPTLPFVNEEEVLDA